MSPGGKEPKENATMDNDPMDKTFVCKVSVICVTRAWGQLAQALFHPGFEVVA